MAALTSLNDLAYGVGETLQNAVSATGNGTPIDMRGVRFLTLDIAGTFTATVTFEGSIDGGVTWFGVGLAKVTDGTYALTATAVGNFVSPPALPALTDFRARVTWTSGTSVTVKSRKMS